MEIHVLSAVRTPIGSFQGALSSMTAPHLGGNAIKAALRNAGVDIDHVEECIMGQVLAAGVGQAPARQAAIFAGLPYKVPCMTINKVCGSGLKAIGLAADSISSGRAQVVVAGGQENMSQAPHLLMGSRTGFRMGHASLTDSMIHDGLWDPYNQFHMGVAAELCVKERSFSREEQDRFAVESYQRAQKAQKEGWFQKEILPVEIKSSKSTLVVSTDEEPEKARFDKIPQLSPAFEKTGTITAANASKINDGAAAVVLAKDSYCQSKGVKPLARILSQGYYAQDPKWFTTAPVGAIQRALNQAKLSVSDIDLWEINEAFSVVTLAAMRELKIPHEKVNVHGGAVALGHPIGASGARIFATLIHALHKYNLRYGVASLCIGGGEGIAVVVEKL